MRATSLLPLLSLPAVWAVPASEFQTVLGEVGNLFDIPEAGSIFEQIAKGAEHVIEPVKKIIHDGKEHVETWIAQGKEFIQQGGVVYERITHPSFAAYQLRVTEPNLCDPSVKQYSGYLDISDEKHLFFWFFESRSAPEKAPLTLWLNGGPGCSSTTGLFFELGPCNIADSGNNLTYNKYSWNSHSNMLFLDQPINVGYSYSSDGSTVSTSPAAAQDVYAFLQLFLSRYPEYSSTPFHMAAESYGGTYAPHFASVIHKKNKELALAPTPGLKTINLASVILANGLTDPYTQFATIPDFVCDGPYPIYDDPEGPECTALRSKVPTCQRLTQACYNFNSRWTCVPAGLYCSSQLFGSLQQLPINPYDVRKSCDRSTDGQLCYKQMSWIETWMNNPANKKALGVTADLKFESCNMQVNQAFAGQGDAMHNTAALLPELINDGVRLLVYAGNADMMCNFIGNEAWVEKLEHKFHKEFEQTESVPWVTLESGRVAGEVRSAGGAGFTAGNVTFVQVYEAGHMVPFDQPEAALDLFTRWIMDVPLSLQEGEDTVL